MLRNNERRGQTAYSIFLAVALFSLTYAAFELFFSMQLESLTDDADSSRTQIFTSINQLAILANFVLLLASAVSFITWSRRAYYNLGAVGVATSYTDSHAIFAWILPVISLYRPYQFVREIWQSTQQQAFGFVSSHALLRVWWTLFLIRSVLGIVVAAASNYMTVEAIRTSLQLMVCTLVFDAIAAFVTARVIHRIMQFEQQLVLTQDVMLLGQPAPEPATLTATDPDLYL